MRADHTQLRSHRAVVPCLAVLGGCALAALAVLGTTNAMETFDPAQVLAGSGDAPTNTVYVQPVVGAATLGQTSTLTTPASAPGVEKAEPGTKAGG